MQRVLWTSTEFYTKKGFKHYKQFDTFKYMFWFNNICIFAQTFLKLIALGPTVTKLVAGTSLGYMAWQQISEMALPKPIMSNRLRNTALTKTNVSDHLHVSSIKISKIERTVFGSILLCCFVPCTIKDTFKQKSDDDYGRGTSGYRQNLTMCTVYPLQWRH